MKNKFEIYSKSEQSLVITQDSKIYNDDLAMNQRIDIVFSQVSNSLKDLSQEEFNLFAKRLLSTEQGKIYWENAQNFINSSLENVNSVDKISSVFTEIGKALLEEESDNTGLLNQIEIIENLNNAENNSRNEILLFVTRYAPSFSKLNISILAFFLLLGMGLMMINLPYSSQVSAVIKNNSHTNVTYSDEPKIYDISDKTVKLSSFSEQFYSDNCIHKPVSKQNVKIEIEREHLSFFRSQIIKNMEQDRQNFVSHTCDLIDSVKKFGY